MTAQQSSNQAVVEGTHTEESEIRLKEFVARILELAKTEGADAAEVAAGDDVGLNVSVRNNTIENVEFSRDRGFEISVYVGQQRGNASTTDTEESSMLEAVRTALSIARHTEPDPYSGLADPDRLATEFPPLDLYHPQHLDVENAEDIALETEAAALARDPKIYKSNGARVGAVSACTAYGNSHGFLQAFRSTNFNRLMGVIAKSDNGMQSAYWYSTARQQGKLDAPEFVGRTAAEQALRKLDPRPIPTGTYPVLFDHTIAPTLISHLMSALSGRNQYLKTTYLHDSLGQQAATEDLTLMEQPFLLAAAGSRAFDSEGVATSSKPFVEHGRVRNYVLNSYSGRKLGMPTTGNASGVCNLTVEAPMKPLTEVMREMGKGLVVTSLMGQGFNVVTGDYSRGAAGYWVEDGEYAYAVDEVTVAGKLDDMFKNMVAFADNVETRRNIQTGSILIDSMTVAAS